MLTIILTSRLLPKRPGRCVSGWWLPMNFMISTLILYPTRWVFVILSGSAPLMSWSTCCRVLEGTIYNIFLFGFFPCIDMFFRQFMFVLDDNSSELVILYPGKTNLMWLRILEIRGTWVRAKRKGQILLIDIYHR
jgi:hypothetical protein